MTWTPPTRSGRDYQIVHKFGADENIGTSFAPVARGSIYRTPQVGGATALRVKAGNAADTADGDGAREVTLIGLDETGQEVTETLATAGESASGNTNVTFIRLYRAFISKSGAYGGPGVNGHAAAVVIEKAAGSEDWATMFFTDKPRGQSEIAAYSVPLGYRAYVRSIKINVATGTNKQADILFTQRGSILDTAAPYEAERMIIEFTGVDGREEVRPDNPWGPFSELTDLIFYAKSSATSQVNIDFEIVLVRNEDVVPTLDYMPNPSSDY